MAEPRNSRDERALVALLLLLALLAAWQLARDETVDLPASLAMPLPRPAPRGAGEPAAAFAEILERPLFSRDRGQGRQAAAVPKAVATPEPDTATATTLDGWTLIGMTSQGDRVVALVREGQGGATRTVRSGDTLDGWTVIGSRGRRVMLLQRDDDQAELSIAAPASTSSTSSEAK